MRRRSFVTVLAGAMLVAAVCAAPAIAQGVAVDDRDRFIVVLEDSAVPGSVASAVDARGGVAVSHVYRHALSGFAARMPEARAAALELAFPIDGPPTWVRVVVAAPAALAAAYLALGAVGRFKRAGTTPSRSSSGWPP